MKTASTTCERARPRSSRQLRVATAVLAAFLSLVRVSSAEDDPPALAESLLRYSLQVDVNERARQALEAADQDIARGSVLSAVEGWRKILEEPPGDGLVAAGDRFLTPQLAVREKLLNQTDDVRAEFEKVIQRAAQSALQGARRTPTSEEFWTILRRYPGTSAGFLAGMELAATSFDSHRYAECAAVCEALLAEAATAPSTSQISLWLAISLSRLGEEGRAREFWQRVRATLPASFVAAAESDREFGSALNEWKQTPLEDVSDEVPPERVGEILPAIPTDPQNAGSDPASVGVRNLLTDFERISHPLLALPAHLSMIDHGGAQPSLRFLQRSTEFSETAATQPVDRARILLGESMLSRSVTIAARTFVITDDAIDTPQDDSHSRRIRTSGRRKIVAVNPDTHHLLWATDDLHALGLPVQSRGLLYYAAQAANRLSLVAVEPGSGRTAWTLSLGTTGLDSKHDPRRGWMPAVCTADGGIVYCATGNGALVAVDTAQRSIRWIHRVDRNDWRGAGPPLAPVAPHTPRLRLWSGWREPLLFRAKGRLIWVSPEDDAIISLNPASGRKFWRRLREAGLAVIPLSDGILVLESNRVRRVGLEQGADEWSVAVPALAGKGFIERGWCVLPLRNGGNIAIRVRDGAVVRGVNWHSELALHPAARPLDQQLRSLDRGADGVVIRDLIGAVTVKSAASDIETKRSQNASAESLAAALAAAGQLDESLKVLEDVDAQKSDAAAAERSFARDALQLLKESAAGAEQPTKATLVRDPLARLRLAIPRMRQRPTAETAMAVLGAALETDFDQWIDVEDSPRRRVLAERRAIAVLLESIAQLQPTDALRQSNSLTLLPAAVAESLDQLLARLIEENRGEGRDRLIRELLSTDWGARQCLARFEQAPPTEKPSIIERSRTRLDLIRLSQADGPEGDRARQLLTETSPPEQLIKPWPEIRPVVTTRPGRGPVTFRPVWKTVVAPGEASRLNLEADILNTNVRFSGAGEHRAWSLRFATDRGERADPDWEAQFPKRPRALQNISQYQRGWMIGPVVLVQAGSRMFAAAPFDEAGRRDARYLWPGTEPVDSLGTALAMNIGYLPRIADGGPGLHPLDLDEFGRPLAQVGPVTPSYFCLREFGRLVAYEIGSGRRLWEREGFDPDAVAYGDDVAVVVVKSKDVEVLSPLDGRMLRRHERRFKANELIGVEGRIAFIRRSIGDGTRRLIALDLATGAELWSQTISEASLACLAGQKWIAVVEPNAVRLMSQPSGEIVATADVETPSQLENVAAIVDEHALIVLASGPPAVAQTRQPYRTTGGPRRPFANGRLYGFHPTSFELRWSLPVEKTVLPLDQPPDLPILVINDAVVDDNVSENHIAEERLWCIDKRTGERVYEGFMTQLGRTAPVIERDANEKWIELRTAKSVIRLEYAKP